MNKNEIFTEKATRGYTVCFSTSCPQHEHCLRWNVGQLIPHDIKDCQCVNPHHDNVATEQCPMFRSAEKVLWARGMTHILTDNMPRRVDSTVRAELIKRLNRTYFFEYRNGTRLISPAMQEEIRTLYQQAGWTGDIQFDEYFEDYDW